MTVPMIIGMIMMMSFGLIDTFFVSLLGTEPLAAISFTFPVTFTLISLNIGLGIGTSAVIARLAGQGKQDGARETGSGALMLSFIMVGILALCGGLSIDFVFQLLLNLLLLRKKILICMLSLTIPQKIDLIILQRNSQDRYIQKCSKCLI